MTAQRVLLLAALAASPSLAWSADTLSAIGGLPAHIAGLFREPMAFEQSSAGDYFVFDRRAHAVYRIDERFDEAKKIVEIGHEEGRVLEPTAFDLEDGGTFVVADAPNRVERIQIFNTVGQRLGGFTLPGRQTSRVTIDALVLGGIGSLQYTGRAVYTNHAETGALITEYSLSGRPLRSIGALRSTGHERDRELHLALNVTLPLVDPAGGFYAILQAGEPLLRRYDKSGGFVFERRIQGRELDGLMRSLPQRWPRRTVDGDELPLVSATVRAAALDAAGNVWIALAVPYIYVYDRDGDKVRTVQLRGAGPLHPVSLAFTGRNRLLAMPGGYEFRVP
jgi:hypothetical protein